MFPHYRGVDVERLLSPVRRAVRIGRRGELNRRFRRVRLIGEKEMSVVYGQSIREAKGGKWEIRTGEPRNETSNHPQNAPTFDAPFGPTLSKIFNSKVVSRFFISSRVTVARSYSFSMQVVPSTWLGCVSTHALVFMKNSVCSFSNVSVRDRMSTP